MILANLSNGLAFKHDAICNFQSQHAHHHRLGYFRIMINIAHNYAKMEHHFGENVLVHRKGATLASDKTIGG